MGTTLECKAFVSQLHKFALLGLDPVIEVANQELQPVAHHNNHLQFLPCVNIIVQ
jgi:hypothetical protein